MGTKHQSSDPSSDSKKRRRVGFTKVDAGVEPNDCIEIYLVSSKEEVDSPDSFCFEPVDLNHFFEEDGKIYGYEGLKITIWVSSISFHAYADITFESTADGGKGITDLKTALQDIFAENLVESKDDFLQSFVTERNYFNSMVSNGEVLRQKVSAEHINEEAFDVQVIRVVGEPVGHVYCRLIPLVLLLVDGSNPIDITDPCWEIYLSVQKRTDAEGNQLRLLGFAAIYRFYHYPDSLRLRLSQILVLPPYQRKGYGRILLEVLNNVAVSENAYDLTVEEPLESLQHVRTCIDVQRLLNFNPIRDPLNSVVLRLKQENLSKKSHSCRFGPPRDAVEEVRKCLKINKKQFVQCWEVLLYIGLDPVDKYIENFKTIILDGIKADVLGKDSGATGKRVLEVPTSYDQEMSFVMFKSQNGEYSNFETDENQQTTQEEQLRQLVDERIKEIELIAQTVSKNRP